VYPGDRFIVTGYVQSYGLTGTNVTVQLATSAAEAGDAGEEAERIEEERRVRLGSDGEILTLKFEALPEQVGARSYRLRVLPPANDHDSRDDARSATMDVVERKNRVLLMASGPTREFQFLRNLLYRERETTVDVYLQTGQPGMAQEADELLFAFPGTAAELFEYDAIIAFDPDWLALDEPATRLLERWIAEQAGGLVVTAGPVHTPRWVARAASDARATTIRGLYPVVFYSRSSATLLAGRFAAETAWPLEFTQEGRTAEFLWLEDDSLLNKEAWSSFPGVYGFFAVKDPKPGATVFARFSDPGSATDGQLPVYLASQFYGAGRVFYQGSGEMWRLRAVDEAYFDRYYTKLVRWVSQGRLLRDSTHGLLLVDKERCLLGDQIAVRAVLTDAQHRPLTTDTVSATLVHPEGRRTAMPLQRSADAMREGVFLGQFTALVEGEYRIELQAPHGGEDETLSKTVRARLPALETERPQRNDALLSTLARRTRGTYYTGLQAARRQAGGQPPLVNRLTPQDQVTYIPGKRDETFERILMTWLLAIICGALALEWLVRRLAKLA
jgi:hypothetical protein